MEILFMVFMVIVSVMALFAVMIVFRDVVQEILVARKEREATDRSIIKHAERIIAEAEAKDAAAKCVCAEPAVVAEPVAAPVVEEPAAEEPVIEEPVIEEPAAEEPVAVEPESDPEGTISFATTQQQTLDEKYLALSQAEKGWYDEIIKYASAVEGSKRFKNARYEEYKVGKNRLVRLLIKRGIIQCEFILHNSDFRNYVNENKINVKQSATTMLVETAETVNVVKNSIDIVVASIAEEKEYKKQLAREKRRAARAAANASEAEAETAEN